jgi:7-keto-8-aminopelargonate synthetase-like enzyme
VLGLLSEDGIYSMHGDVAPMGALRELLARHERLHLYIDDAHGMSWTGKHGRGHVLGDGRIAERMVVTVSLAKAFSASGGALIFPDRESARLVRTCGSTMIFSGPLQPARCWARASPRRASTSPPSSASASRSCESGFDSSTPWPRGGGSRWAPRPRRRSAS